MACSPSTHYFLYCINAHTSNGKRHTHNQICSIWNSFKSQGYHWWKASYVKLYMFPMFFQSVFFLNENDICSCCKGKITFSVQMFNSFGE